MIDKTAMYTSVRQEILDQKKCQFNLFGASITLTAAILAYAAATKVGALVYVVPILINVLSLTIILDKAISIQRMVGYLQLMESNQNKQTWMWEFHLNKFREIQGKSRGSESFRKHTYIITISSILTLINLLSASLYRWGPSAIALRNSSSYSEVSEFYGAVNFVVLILLAYGVFLAIRRWGQLVFGIYTGRAIRDRWLEAINKAEQGNAPNA